MQNEFLLNVFYSIDRAGVLIYYVPLCRTPALFFSSLLLLLLYLLSTNIHFRASGFMIDFINRCDALCGQRAFCRIVLARHLPARIIFAHQIWPQLFPSKRRTQLGPNYGHTGINRFIIKGFV